MALNKLKTGVAFSSQVPEQNANLEILDGLLTGVTFDYAGEVTTNLTNFAYSCKNNTKFFTNGEAGVGLPEGVSNYGIGFVLGRTKDMSGSAMRWIVYFDVVGRIATRARTGSEWSTWRVHEGVKY